MESLAMSYGKGEGNTVTHYYDKKSSKTRKKKKCKKSKSLALTKS
jgi:hypothetical protein